MSNDDYVEDDYEEVLPDPERMIEGLRDTGYDFKTAVADIIDNSIAANATTVDIQIDMDFRGKIRLSIADDGIGMNAKGLKDAMRYGSQERPDPASLGKYGLGLKTASTAFCRRLTVISRDGGSAPLMMGVWDLDHVADSKKWELLLTDKVEEEATKHLEEVANESSGTVVLWTKIDRLLKDYVDPGGAFSKKALKKRVEELKEHTALVYQRFLDSDDQRAHNISMTINGATIKSFDPFQKGVSELLASKEIQVQTESGDEASFVVKAYVLPRREEFSNPELAKEARLSSDMQGVFIYRENRSIVQADWLGMFKKEPHYSLLRVEFSFDHRLDLAFDLDIKKSQIRIKDDIITWLSESFLTAPRREANRRYRIGQQKDISDQSEGAHDNSNSNIGNREAVVGGANVSIADPNSGEVLVENSHGKFRLKIPIGSAHRPGEVYIQPVDSITDGLLFEPALIEQHRAVRLSTSHPYYHKVYVPNLSKSVTLQGMDALLWALCVAELTTIRDSNSELFSDMRYEVSRILGKLVETLPEPESGQDVA